MKIVQLLQTKNMRLVLMAVLLVTALVPQNASAVESQSIDSAYDFIWANDMNITVYFPATTSSLSEIMGVGLTQIDPTSPLTLASIESVLERNAQRDLKVYYDYDRDLIAVEMMLSWSTDSNAISFEDYRTGLENGIKLSDNSSNPIIDVLPDDEAIEGDVSRKATDVAGAESERLDNDTAIDTTTAITVDFTDYNHSSGDWLELNQFKMSSATNATVKVAYSFSNGTIYETVTILNTDQFFAVQDHYVYLTMPTLSTATYVDTIIFDDLQVDNWRTYKWAAEYENERSDLDFDIESAGIALSGFNPFTDISLATKNAITQFKASKSTTPIAQRAVGFLDMKKSALQAAATALKADVSKIVDHQVNAAQDKVTASKQLVSDLHTKMEDTWDKGERSAQSLAREARAGLKAVTLTVGVKAAEFGDAAEHAVEMGSDVIKGAVGSASSALTAATTNGKSMFDKVKNSLGQLPNKAAGLFAKIDPSKFMDTIKDNLKWIIIAAVILVVVILAIKFM